MLTRSVRQELIIVGSVPHDLSSRADVERLVIEFYRRAYADPLIGPIFTDIAKMDLEAHLPIMCDFWETVLFRAGVYRRNALQVHRDLHALSPLLPEHFERWLLLWNGTVDELFAGEKAELAKLQAERVAASIGRRLAGSSGSGFETIATRADAGA